MADLLAVTAGRTTLLITHEMDGLDQLDEIVVLDKGRTVARGSHRHLGNSHGHYRLMRQAAAARPAEITLRG